MPWLISSEENKPRIYLDHNPSGCARLEIFKREDRFKNPYYRARIQPIYIHGLARPVTINCDQQYKLEPTTTVDHEAPSIVSSSIVRGERGRKAGKNPTFLVSDFTSSNLPLVLRYRQLPELVKRRLRVAKSLIHGTGIFATEVIRCRGGC